MQFPWPDSTSESVIKTHIMVVGRLQPKGKGNDHEDVDEVLCEPGEDEAAVFPPDPQHHQHRDHDVAQVEHNHEPSCTFHCCEEGA